MAKTKDRIITTSSRKTSAVPAVKTATSNAKKASPAPPVIATTKATQPARAAVAAKAKAIADAKKPKS